MPGRGDVAVAAIAAAQRGAIDFGQLAAAGLGRGAIEYRLARGRLHRRHRGVYLVGHGAAAELAEEVAALLACGPGAVLSHRSAAALWGLLRHRGPVHISVRGGRPRHRGVRAHRTTTLQTGDLGTIQRLPVTAPARTLVDLSSVLPIGELERALAESELRRLVSHDDLCARAENARGAATLRALLSQTGGPAFTRSEAERRLLALIRAARLPAPQVNARVAGLEVDFLWPAERLVVEMEGYAFHSSRAAFERDARRQRTLRTAGLTVIRVTWRQLVGEAEAVLADIVRALSANR